MLHYRVVTDDRRLTTQGLQRKEQLLGQAAELFAERGYSETRVADIVAAAGVAKGLFYWYFANKEELFFELVEHHRLTLRKAQAEAMDPNAEPLVKIHQGAEASVRHMALNARFFALLELENSDVAFAEEKRRGTDIHSADVAAILEEGIADGTIRDEPPMLMSYGVVGAVGYFCHFHRTGRIDLSVDELAAFVGRHVVCALASDEKVALRVLS